MNKERPGDRGKLVANQLPSSRQDSQSAYQNDSDKLPKRMVDQLGNQKGQYEAAEMEFVDPYNQRQEAISSKVDSAEKRDRVPSQLWDNGQNNNYPIQVYQNMNNSKEKKSKSVPKYREPYQNPRTQSHISKEQK